MNSAKTAVSNAISNLKSKFNFSWSLPKLRLPHVSISGRFSLSPLRVPSFGISWYKKAMDDPMMLTQPTLFGQDKSGNGLAGGEAGDEVVIGKDTMIELIQSAVAKQMDQVADSINAVLERIFNLLADYIPELANMQLVTDTGALVGELAPAMDSELGRISSKKQRGN